MNRTISVKREIGRNFARRLKSLFEKNNANFLRTFHERFANFLRTKCELFLILSVVSL